MISVSEVSDVAQAIGNAAVVVSLLFLYYQTRLTRQQAEDTRIAQQEQLKAVQSQVEASLAQSQGQNVFALIEYLEKPEHIKARRRVYASLKGKPFERWSKEDVTAADTAARIYQVAASFQYAGVLPPRWLHIQYGGSMCRTWDIIKPYIDDLRARTDPAQRRDYERLYDEMRDLGWYEPSAGQVPPLWPAPHTANPQTHDTGSPPTQAPQGESPRRGS
jgi:hypothetical protein